MASPIPEDPVATGATPVASGRTADVFALPGDRVLRRYRTGPTGDPVGGDPEAEAAVMRYAAERGYPVPRVHAARGPDLVMDRLPGPTMAGQLLGGGLDPASAGTELAALHNRLHRLPAPPGLPRAGSGGPPLPADRLLHLDLHPENVLAGPGPTAYAVIDWTNAAAGPPGLDPALAAVLLVLAVAAPQTPLAVQAGPRLPALVAEFTAAFLAAAEGDPAGHLDQAVAFRLRDPSITPAERRLLEDGTAARDVRALLP